MKYQTTPAFDGDIRRLSDGERRNFGRVIKEKFVPAADAVATDPGSAKWPKQLRVKSVKGAAGIWEMTWSFSGPDGRATFEWIAIDGQPAIRWHRVGGHEIFKDPAGR
ncbi:MAG: hypothetical protein ACR2GT_13035 [Gaiellaceae bacterium]